MREFVRTKERTIALALAAALGAVGVAGSGCSSPEPPEFVLETPWLIDCVAQSPNEWGAAPTEKMNEKPWTSVDKVAINLLVSTDRVKGGKSGHVTCDPEQTPIITVDNLDKGAPLLKMKPPLTLGVTDLCAPIGLPIGHFRGEPGWNVMLAICPAAAPQTSPTN